MQALARSCEPPSRTIPAATACMCTVEASGREQGVGEYQAMDDASEDG